MKKILFGLALALVLFVGGVQAYLYSDGLRRRVETELEAAITRDVMVGAVEISVWRAFPNLSVDLVDVRVSDPERPSQDLLDVPRVRIRVALGPLMHDVLVCRVALEGVRGRVRASADGSSNLDDLVADAWLDQPATFEAVVLEGVRIEDAELAFENAAGRTLRLTGVAATLAATLAADSTAFDGEVRAAGVRLGALEAGPSEDLAALLALTMRRGADVGSLELTRALLSVGPHTLDLNGLPVDWNSIPRLVDLAFQLKHVAGLSALDLARAQDAMEDEVRSWVDAEKQRRRSQLEDALRRRLERVFRDN